MSRRNRINFVLLLLFFSQNFPLNLVSCFASYWGRLYFGEQSRVINNLQKLLFLIFAALPYNFSSNIIQWLESKSGGGGGNSFSVSKTQPLLGAAVKEAKRHNKSMDQYYSLSKGSRFYFVRVIQLVSRSVSFIIRYDYQNGWQEEEARIITIISIIIFIKKLTATNSLSCRLNTCIIG